MDWGAAVEAEQERDVEAEQLLAARVREHLDALSEGLAHRLRDAFPPVADLGPEFLTGIRDRNLEVLRAGAALFEHGASLDVLGPALEQGLRERREQRIPRDLVLRAYGVLQEQFFDDVARLVRDHPDALRLTTAMGRRQLEFQQLLWRRADAAYEGEEAVPNTTRDASGQAVLEELVGLRAAGALADHTTRFGLLLPLDTIAVTVRLGAGGPPGEVLDPRIRQFARAHPWSVVGALDGRAVYVGRGLIGALPDTFGRVALPPDAGPAEVSALVARAGQAADVAARLGRPSGDAAALDPLVAVAALSEDRREAFLDATFGPLRSSGRESELLDAVAAVNRFGNRREAAEHLHVHTNTLDARLARFRELTGLDLADPVQRLQCDLALFTLGRLR